MAPKTAKQLIKGALANLTKENFEQFRDELLNREEEPRVKRNQVEDKNIIAVADLLVSTFTGTGTGALAVVVELLKEIGCHHDAEKLETEIGGQSSNPGSSDTVRPSAGAEGGCTGADFVDKHRSALIDRVSNIGPILDELFEEKVITTQEAYDAILALSTSSNRMRMLYSGPLHSAGPEGKEVFYKILEEKEKYLVAGLKKKK